MFFFFFIYIFCFFFFFFSSRRRHTRLTCDWSSDVCSSDLQETGLAGPAAGREGCKETSGIDGDGSEPVLCTGGNPDRGRVDAGIVEQACGRREKAQTDSG